VERRNFKLSDGRNLEYCRNQIESDSIVIFHAGTMQDITGWKTWLDYCESNKVAALAFGRSGYVASTKKPGRITIDVARDISELADHFEISRMVNVGLSGGGQHALATGLDPRTAGVVTIGSLAPYAELGEHFFDGMQQADLDEYDDALVDINLLIERFQGYLNPHEGEAGIPMEIAPNDRKARENPSWKILMDSVAFTASQGWDWVADDYSSYLTPWGFDPREITVPVSIWQGGLDKNVPPQHGHWLSQKISGSTLHLKDDDSHIGLYINYEIEIMKDAIRLLRP
jgi:pimeloyl-ACP methyl ester carboxylesterase